MRPRQNDAISEVVRASCAEADSTFRAVVAADEADRRRRSSRRGGADELRSSADRAGGEGADERELVVAAEGGGRLQCVVGPDDKGSDERVVGLDDVGRDGVVEAEADDVPAAELGWSDANECTSEEGPAVEEVVIDVENAAAMQELGADVEGSTG